MSVPSHGDPDVPGDSQQEGGAEQGQQRPGHRLQTPPSHQGRELLSPYSSGNGVRVGYPTRMKSTHKK